MPRFLSTEWFDEVERGSGPNPPHPPPAAPANGRLVLEQVVRATPDGDVRYRVVVESGAARIERAVAGAGPPADLTISCDWDTAVAMAQGKLSTQAALMHGRLRLKGNLASVGKQADQLAGLDAVPAEIRSRTTY